MEKKFGDVSSRFDGVGDYISIPDTDVDFKIDGWRDFEAWSWMDKDGKFHIEIKFAPPNTAWSRLAQGWRKFARRVVSFFKRDQPA